MGLSSHSGFLHEGEVSDGKTWYQMDGYSTKPINGSVFNGSEWTYTDPNAMNFDSMYQKANPWSSQAPKYQNKLAQLLETPGAMASNPAYQYSFDQGIEAVNRSAAAMGQLGSGNRLAELTKFGQGEASKNFFNLANLYSKLAGADSQNAAGAVSSAAGAVNGQTNAMASMMSAKNGVKPIVMHSGMDLSNFNPYPLY